MGIAHRNRRQDHSDSSNPQVGSLRVGVDPNPGLQALSRAVLQRRGETPSGGHGWRREMRNPSEQPSRIGTLDSCCCCAPRAVGRRIILFLIFRSFPTRSFVYWLFLALSLVFFLVSCPLCLHPPRYRPGIQISATASHGHPRRASALIQETSRLFSYQVGTGQLML